MRRWLENYLYGLGLKQKLMLFVGIVLSFFILQNIYVLRREFVILSNYSDDSQNYSKISELKNTIADNNTYLNEYFEESILKNTDGFNESTLSILSGFNRTGYEMFEIIEELEASVKSLDEYLWIEAISNACEIYREEANKTIREHNNNIRENQDKVNRMYGYIDIYIGELLAESSRTREAGYNQLFEEWNKSKNVTIVLLIIITLFIYMTGSLFTRYITNNIKRIIKLHEKIGTGDFASEMSQHSLDDEMGQLNQSFNDMQKNIREQIDTLNEKAVMQQRLYQEELLNMEMQKALNEAKYAMLQSQINPHFLFNTLNIISRKAMFKDSDEAVRLIRALSELFRHALIDVSEKVSLQKELDVINEYLYIQKTRFRERLNIEFINEVKEADQIMVPPLILQPIVENAIIHGIEPLEEEGKLRIIVTKESEDVFVEISDNGVGISGEKLEMIQNATIKHDAIGLRNVKERMEFFFSEECFWIESNERGTRVKLKFLKIL